MKCQLVYQHPFYAVCVSCLVVSVGDAKDLRITPGTDVESMLEQVAPGDSIVLKNGTWVDARLKFERLAGTADAPIRIRAETAGKVVFSGATEFRVSGQHVILSGVVFRNTRGVSDVVQLRTHSQRHAHNCRITGCVFEQSPDLDTDIESRWLSVYGTHNRIDHCYFVGKKNRGCTLVVWVSETLGEHRIDHNHFGPRPELGRNGGETICIGTSDVSELNCRTVVEDNFFHECNGEAEIISNKSCENIYRHNVFLPDKWPLFRVQAQPARCVWEGNKHQKGRVHEDQLVRFKRVDVPLIRAVDGLLRPTTVEVLRTEAASPVKKDIDGHSRGHIALAGCDDPNTPLRDWPSPANTGPAWSREAVK